MIVPRVLTAIFLLASALSGRGTRYPLPAAARVTGLKLNILDPKNSDVPICKQQFHLSERQIRRRFRTYRELGPGDEHDHYAWMPCSMDGNIVYRGKSFYVHANMANTMWTDWPDGRDKELGGVHDGELSD